METEPAPRWVRWGWRFTLVAVCAGTTQGILTGSSRPVDGAALLLLPGLLALPWLGAAPAAFEGTRSCPRRFRLLALLGIWVLVPLLLVFGGLWAATLPPLDEWTGLSWLLAVSLALSAASAIAQAGRPPHARLVLMGVCGGTVLVTVLVWGQIECQPLAALQCLAIRLASWPLRLVCCLSLILAAALLDRRARTRGLVRRRLALSALALLFLVPVVAMAPVPTSRRIEPDRVETISDALLTDSGDLLMAISLDRGGTSDYRVLRRSTESRLRVVSGPSDFQHLVSVAPDGSSVSFIECPSVAGILFCRRCREEIQGCVDRCPYLSLRVVDTQDGGTVHVEEVPQDEPFRNLPILGPRGVWADADRIRLASGEIIKAPVPKEQLVAGWGHGTDLLFLRAEPSTDGASVSMTTIDSRTAMVHSVSLPITSIPRSRTVSPDGRFALLQTQDGEETVWWSLDASGQASRIDRRASEVESIIVWGQSGRPAFGRPDCAVDSYAQAVQFASTVYYSGPFPADGGDCRIEVDGIELPLRSLGASSEAQWLADSIVYVVEGRRVVRLWPDADRVDTLFAVAEPK